MAKIKSLKPSIKQLDTTIGSNIATERIRGNAHRKIRDRILARDNYTCCDCGRFLQPKHLEVDHVQPLSDGGAEADNNRVTRCMWCHKLKSEKEEKERHGNKKETIV